MLTIQLFARARDLAGQPTVQIPWTAGDSVADLRRRLLEQYPALAPVASRLLVAVNNSYADDSTTIQTQDDVACFPPVSGG